MLNDPIYEGFLQRQVEDGSALACASDILELDVVDETTPSRFVARYRVETLFVTPQGIARGPEGIAQGIIDLVVGIQFHRDYLRRADPFRVLTFLAPHHVFHPNIAPPWLCLGPIAPGTGIVDLLYRIHAVVTFNNVTPREDDALNPRACAWARRHRDRFPIDARPLKRPLR